MDRFAFILYPELSLTFVKHTLELSLLVLALDLFVFLLYSLHLGDVMILLHDPIKVLEVPLAIV